MLDQLSIRLPVENILSNPNSFHSAIRGFSYELNPLYPYIWVEVSPGQYSKLNLNIGDYLHWKITKPICQKCYSRGNLVKNICETCLTKDKAKTNLFLCRFNKDNSLKNSTKCTSNNYACKNQSNGSQCHSSHIVYIGVIGNHIKVGVSRVKRTGGYMMRLIEQGFNKAFIITGINSIIDAHRVENYLKSHGFVDRIPMKSKMETLGKLSMKQIDITHIKNILKSLNMDLQFRYVDLFELKNFDQIKYIPNPHNIKGEIILIQGSILLTKYKNQIFGFDFYRIVHRKIKKFSIRNGGIQIDNISKTL